MNSQQDYPMKLVNNSYNSLGANYQRFNQFNRPSSHTHMTIPDNYFGVKYVKLLILSMMIISFSKCLLENYLD